MPEGLPFAPELCAKERVVVVHEDGGVRAVDDSGESWLQLERRRRRWLVGQVCAISLLCVGGILVLSGGRSAIPNEQNFDRDVKRVDVDSLPIMATKAPGTASPEAALQGQQPKGKWWGYLRSVQLMKEKLPAPLNLLKPLHHVKKPPRPGDWMERTYDRGRSFFSYQRSWPTRASRRRRYLVILPIGRFSSAQRRLLKRTAHFMNAYFCLPVRMQKARDLKVPSRARRQANFGRQLLTSYLLDHVLKPALPDDAAVYLALTSYDLWPGEGWNFVYGQAYLRKRVAVWSIRRMGELGKSEAQDRQALRRTLKIATHETGHMFSIVHCAGYECNMNGTNNMSETDRSPVAMCPTCLAKLQWNLKCDLSTRFRALARLSKRWGLSREAALYSKSLKALP